MPRHLGLFTSCTFGDPFTRFAECESILFEAPSPCLPLSLLTEMAHLLTATLSLSLHVARNDMRLPMLRTDSVPISHLCSLSTSSISQLAARRHRCHNNLCSSSRQKTTNLAALRCAASTAATAQRVEQQP